MNDIKISVIISVYNTEKYIEKCIESILYQSLKEIEIIVVNDGSKDKSLKILNDIKNKYKEREILVIDKINEGVSKARNEALKKATGKYVLIIDSDDWIEEDYLMETYIKAEKNNLDIVVTDYFYEFEITKKKKYTKDLDILDQTIIDSSQYLEKFFLENFKGFNVNKLLKRKIIEKYNIRYNENIKMMEDALFLIEFIKYSSRIGKINKAYYYYLQHNNNVTKNINISHLYDVEKVFYELNQKFKKNNYINLLLQKRKVISKLELIFAYKGDLSNSEYKEYLNEFLKEIKNVSVKNIKKSIFMSLIINCIRLFPVKILIILLKKVFDVKNKLKKR